MISRPGAIFTKCRVSMVIYKAWHHSSLFGIDFQISGADIEILGKSNMGYKSIMTDDCVSIDGWAFDIS
ncbi:hypothetical protein Q427_19425 [Halomonas sp. BC04]|nr:hypothetical protein Q427_19425 [Halomonas sp. BC04]